MFLVTFNFRKFGTTHSKLQQKISSILNLYCISTCRNKTLIPIKLYRNVMKIFFTHSIVILSQRQNNALHSVSKWKLQERGTYFCILREFEAIINKFNRSPGNRTKSTENKLILLSRSTSIQLMSFFSFARGKHWQFDSETRLRLLIRIN